MFVFLRTNIEFDVSQCHKLLKVYSSSDEQGKRCSLFIDDLKKPVSDSFHQVDEKTVIMFDGVLANSTELITCYGMRDIQSLLQTAILDDPAHYLSQFHGQFCTLNYSIVEDKLRICANQTNAMRVYYYNSKNILIASTSLKMVNSLLKANGINTSVDEIGARMILTFGYMLSDYTTIKEIRQLGAGNCLEFSHEKMQVSSYHRFNNETLHTDLNSAVPVLDELFKKAVDCAFRKDDEFGKMHLSFLSGGLDSRQTVFNAYQLGYQKQSCLNFSQPGYADEVTARSIAKKLGLDFIFYPLTNGDYLLRLDRNLAYNEGQIILHGAAHLYEAISTLNLDQYGILHSGQIGDYVLGSYLTSPRHIEPNVLSGTYSSRLLNTIAADIKPLKDQYPNQEIFHLYNRAFNAAMNGEYACGHQTHGLSPFLHPGFAQYGFNISPALRYNVLCYYAWMRRFNPEGARFPWEKTGTNLLKPHWYAQMNQFRQRVVNKACRLAHIPNQQGMNPFEIWWNENPKLRQQFPLLLKLPDSLRARISPELREDMSKLCLDGSFSERLQVYTLSKGLEYLYSEC